MKKFIAIGSDHASDVGDYVKRTLGEHRPEAITLEGTLEFFHESLLDKFTEGTGFKYNPIGDTPHLQVGNFIVIWWPFGRAPETRIAVEYALEKEIPFYFVDWDSDLEGITQWDKGKVKTIPVGTSHYNFSKDVRIYTGNIPARNRFMANAINYLFETHQVIAHIGGRYHFQSGIPLSEEDIKYFQVVKIEKEMELQHLVEAEQKYVYDAVNSLRVE